MNQNTIAGFASDNSAGVHPKILEAMVYANQGHVLAYGEDPYTASALTVMKREFNADAEIFFVFNGTGANVSGLASITRSYNAIICAESAHINSDECCSPECFTGCKLIDIKTQDGKLNPFLIAPYLDSMGDEHQAQPFVISITQASEWGTVYRPDEIQKLADFAHNNHMILHMDGARLANAAAFLDCSLMDISGACGVDLLSFGGTKNGMMYGEAVIFFNPSLAREYRFIRKQTTQLASKMRYIAVQFETLLHDELWRKNARVANNMATYLLNHIANLPGIECMYPVEANAVFIKMPSHAMELLQKEMFFYITRENGPVARFMTSFDTKKDDIHRCVRAIEQVLEENSCIL